MPALIKPRTKAGQDFHSLGRLLFLFDANDAARYYANGDAVSTWFDLSNNGFTLTNTGANRPTLNTAYDAFGNSAVVFNGSSQWLALADANYLDDVFVRANEGITYFYVANHDVSTGASGVIINKFTATGMSLSLYLTGGATYMKYFTSGSTTLDVRGNTNVGTDQVIGISTYSSTLGTDHFLNGTQEGETVVSSTGNGAYTANAGAVNVGRLSTGSQYLKGSIGILGAYQGVMDTTTRRLLERALSARFQKAVYNGTDTAIRSPNPRIAVS